MCTYRVDQDQDGAWVLRGSALRKALAFGSRVSAVERAEALAAKFGGGELRVRSRDGHVETVTLAGPPGLG